MGRECGRPDVVGPTAGSGPRRRPSGVGASPEFSGPSRLVAVEFGCSVRVIAFPEDPLEIPGAVENPEHFDTVFRFPVKDQVAPKTGDRPPPKLSKARTRVRVRRAHPRHPGEILECLTGRIEEARRHADTTLAVEVAEGPFEIGVCQWPDFDQFPQVPSDGAS